MTDSSSADGVDIENPTRSAPIGSSTVDSGSTSVGSRTKKWGLVSAFLLVAVVVAISVGVILGSGGGGETAATAKTSNSAAENAAAPTTSAAAAANDGKTFVVAPQDENERVIDKVRYLDNPQAALVGGESKVRIIDPSVTRGYNSCNELMEDLRNALNYYVNSVIDYEAKYNTMYEQCDPNDPNNGWLLYDDTTVVEDVVKSGMTDAAAGDDPIMTGASPRSSNSKNEKENSYETKNQVPGVDEADYVKSDGEYVFAAYGEVLYAWNALDGPNKGVSITELPYDKVKVCDFTTQEPIPLNETEVSSSNSSTVKEEPCYYYQPKPVIVALLLHEDRLTAIVSEDTDTYSSMTDMTQLVPKTISAYTKLTIHVYDISNVQLDNSPLTLLAKSEKPIKGSYNAALSNENTGILAVTSSIDTYSLVGDLYRYNTQYCGLNSTEYTKLAVETASNRTDTFAASMLEELRLQLDGTCESIVQFAAMQSGASTQDASNGQLLGAFVQVVKFDMASEFMDKKIVLADSAGSFLPGWPYVYATQDFLATFSVGLSYNITASAWDSTSFILGFDISGDTTASPRPYCFTEVPGNPLSESFFADVFEGYLRVLTTESVGSDINATTITTISVLEVPSSTSDAGTEMQLTSKISQELESPFDSALFARFIKDWGYVETSIGPSFVYDMSDPFDPKPVGGLETSSHSTYLEPIKIDGVSHMLGVGTVVNETSWESGLKLTLFDVSDPTNLLVKATHVEMGAYSISGYDFKSLHYLEQSHKLIVPKQVYTYNENYTDTGMNFDGFVVYDVNVTNITPIYDIRHMLSEDVFNGCNNKAYLPGRSFVFESKLTTILSHSVINTDLETGEHLWTYNLENRSNTIDCERYSS